MNVTGDSVDVSTYFVLRLAATGVEATGLTITDFDLQYVRTGVAPVAKVDATALAATDSAHADNKAIEVDPTDQPGLYRVDWPDAAFAAGVKQVILTVKCATCFTEHLAVEIDAPVNVTKLVGGSQSAADLKDFADDGYDPSTNKVQGVVLTDTVTTYTGNTPQTGDNFARLGAPAGASIAADIATRLAPTTAGRTLDVTAAGNAGIDWANVENPTTALNLSGTNIDVDQVVAAVSGAVGSVTAGVTLAASAVQAIWDALTSALTTAGSIGKLLVDQLNATVGSRATQTSVDAVQADTDNIQTRLPAALVSGRMDSSVGAMATDTLTAAALAADAVTEIQSGLSTLTAAGIRTAIGLGSANLDTQLGDLPTNAELATALDPLPTAAEIRAEIDSNSTKLDVATSTRLATAGYAAPPTADQNADALLDRTAGVETNRTPRQALRLMLASLAGKLSGAATTTVAIRDTNDSKDRITATVDASGNRTAVTLDAS